MKNPLKLDISGFNGKYRLLNEFIKKILAIVKQMH